MVARLIWKLTVPSNLHTTAMSPPAAVVGAEDEAPYRTMSVLSIVGLVLGVAAPLAMFAPLLFAIPIAGAAVSLLALRRIALSEGRLSGEPRR